MATGEATDRIYWIDAAKACGIFLVFYGHLIQAGHLLDSGADSGLLLSLKFVYSFHMPLFFILAGFVASRRRLDFLSFSRQALLTRFVPFLFFNFLVFLERVGRETLHHGAFPYRRFLVDPLASIALGSPVLFNTVTWFVICLLTVEFYHFWSKRIIRTKGISAASWLVFSWLAIYPIGCVVIGGLSSFSSWLTTHPMGHTMVGKLLLLPSAMNIWYLPEALVAYPFYYLGVFLRERGVIDHLPGRRSRGMALAASLSVCLLTYNLNNQLFMRDPRVLMLASYHGNPVLFPLTAIAGSICVIIASSLMPRLRPISFIGRNSLILMGLNGLYTFSIFNRFIAQRAAALTGDQRMLHTPVSIGLCIVGTLILIAPCVPVIELLNRYAPQFVGRGAAWPRWAAMERWLAGYRKAISGFLNIRRGERRRYPRKHVAIPAFIQMGDAADGRNGAAILDISLGGIYVSLPQECFSRFHESGKGLEFDVSFALPPYAGAITVACKTERVAPSRGDGCVGASFVRVDSSGYQHLRQYLMAELPSAG